MVPEFIPNRLPLLNSMQKILGYSIVSFTIIRILSLFITPELLPVFIGATIIIYIVHLFPHIDPDIVIPTVLSMLFLYFIGISLSGIIVGGIIILFILILLDYKYRYLVSLLILFIIIYYIYKHKKQFILNM